MARPKRRRARTVQEGLVGKDEYRVLDPNGNAVSTKGYRPLALTRAQMLALNHPDQITYTVERRSLVGPPVELYRVIRDEDGVVLTYVTNPED